MTEPDIPAGFKPPPEGFRVFWTAHHEAAHAVAAWRQGLRVYRISTDPDEAQALGDPWSGVTCAEPGTHDEYARLAIAGWLRDQEALRVPELSRIRIPEPHHDIVAFEREVALYSEETGLDPCCLRSTLREETEEMLLALQDQRLGLANALRRALAMDEPDILAILGPYPH